MSSAFRIALLLLLASVLAPACGDGPTKPRLPLLPALKGKVAYVSFREFYPQVYAMNANGSNQTRLTNRPIWNDAPVWSPDGRRIAWIHARDESIGLWVMNADGSNQRNLTPGMAPAYPSWSPDGQTIAFSAGAETNGYTSEQVFTVNSDGSGLTRLTKSGTGGYYPRWSPEGSKIAFLTYLYQYGSVPDVFVMNVDGTGQLNLSNTAINYAPNGAPDWSPDGRKIAFVSWRDGNSEIYVVNADGSGLTRVTNNSVNDNDPLWSPDGSHILFYHDYQMAVMHPDGSGQGILSGARGVDSGFKWSPDGKWIIFAHGLDDAGHSDLYAMKYEGTGLTRLTADSSSGQPDWGLP